MHEGDVKQFEEMTHAELLAAARFWRSEYERVARQVQGGFVLFPVCAKCGTNHDPAWTCYPAPWGGYALTYNGGR